MQKIESEGHGTGSENLDFCQRRFLYTGNNVYGHVFFWLAGISSEILIKNEKSEMGSLKIVFLCSYFTMSIVLRYNIDLYVEKLIYMRS